MKRDEKIDLLMLLSALEAWSFASQNPFPDYLGEQVENTVNQIRDSMRKTHND
jgi:hypothetical protein